MDRTDPAQQLRVTVLAGGIGAATFLLGLRRVLAGRSASITVIGNTADDITLHGLHVSPDLDTVMYTLGGGIHPEQRWGRDAETFTVAEELAAYGAVPDWFTLGDRDLATHVIRTQMLSAGYSLTDVTAALCHRWFAHVTDPEVALLPMSDDRVETHVVTSLGEGDVAMHFQEWWVRHRAKPAASRIVLVGIDQARATDAVEAAVAAADLVILPPSNPVVSLGPILALPGLRGSLAATSSPVIGVSPIISGAPVRGMADACLRAIGVPPTAEAVAEMYADVLDGWLVDDSDAAVAEDLAHHGIQVASLPLLMADEESTTAIAAATVAMGERLASS